MSINTLYAAESWEKIYQAFETINFVSYDYDSIKQSLIDYLKFYYPENFNDYIESSQLIAVIETFAYVAELLAYRVDLAAHENFISTAERKQSILRLAKLISYSATRNVPLRGFVKLTSISITESIFDSQGNNLTNKNIIWNDPNNPLWKEQFFLVMNRLMTQQFGNPLKSFQVDDTVFQQYEILNNTSTNTFENGCLPVSVRTNDTTYRFELVPSDIDESGVFERDPNDSSHFSILYADDGFGDASPTSGFLMYLKQGQQFKLSYNFDSPLPNRILDVNVQNINNTDVWVQKIDASGNVEATWAAVPTVNSQNIYFNSLSARQKYEVQSLENDSIRIIFGDGDFADIPTGQFNIRVRASANQADLIIQKNKIVDQATTFGYTSKQGVKESSTIRFSLTAPLQNSAASEDIEHIRQVAPATYYTQNRMVNGEDYNTFLLKDPTILRLKAINRSFAGQPKYITWNDASGQYQNVKIFGNDLRLYQDIVAKSFKSTISSREVVDKVIEPLLKNAEVINLLIYITAHSAAPWNTAFILPRTTFIEDSETLISGVPLQEKTALQGVIDRHWYGEPDQVIVWPVTLNKNDLSNPAVAKKSYALVSDTDKLIYDPNFELLKINPSLSESGLDPVNYPYVPVNLSPNNKSGFQNTVARMKRFGIRYTNRRNMVGGTAGGFGLQTFLINQDLAVAETWSAQLISSEGTFLVYGSVSGLQPPAKVGTTYDNGIVRFLITENPNQPYKIGDAFIFDVQFNAGSYSVANQSQLNLAGQFEIIPESSIQDATLSKPFDVNSSVNSWVMIVERQETSDGVFLNWNVTYRAFNLVAYSKTTKFWYNSDMYLIDQDTKKRIRDSVRILKSNLTADRTMAIGTDAIYDVVSDLKFSNGAPNQNGLIVSPSDGLTTYFSGDDYPDNPMQFENFIQATDYVYFEKVATSDALVPIDKTPYLESLTYIADTAGNETSGSYVRKRGRDNLDFLWQHFTPHNNLIDPSVSNINDLYIMTRGYYANTLNYIRGITSIAPVPPTALDLRNSYRDLLQNKMISDTVVLHHGKLKLLFGSRAIPELRATLKVIKNKQSKIANDQLKVRIVDIINEYFRIENWDFAQTFYATELFAVIHKGLPLDIDSVVLLPSFPTNYFGSMFSIDAGQDEILHSCANIEDIQIITDLDRTTLRQK